MARTGDGDGDRTTLAEDESLPDGALPATSAVTDGLALVLVWSKDEPWRVGEALHAPTVPGRTIWFGRGTNVAGREPKSTLGQQRPGPWIPSTPLLSPAVSRYQLALSRVGARYQVRNAGKCALYVDGAAITERELSGGELLQLGKQYLFLASRRPLVLGEELSAYPSFAFGQADAYGLVGESPSMWQIRRTITFIAARPEHVLVTGESGSGKELVAGAIHSLSTRGRSRMVSRNAATLPATLLDAELFGNSKNYPNAGMPERPGLIGEAHESTLFLDEFAELSPALQVHLLRVLDHGEYQRLGEARTRFSDFRLIAATNRPVSSIRPDLLARFAFRVALPELNRRLEDVPLLVRHFLCRLASRGDSDALELFPGRDPNAEPRIPLAWITRLLTHRYRTNVRELEALLWECLLSRQSGTEALDTRSMEGAPVENNAGASTVLIQSMNAPEAERIQRILDEHNGSMERAWRALGLSSRFALQRLVKKHRLEVRRRPGAAR